MTFRIKLIVEEVEGLSLGAVHVEPEVTDEVLLVKEGAIGAEEGVLVEATQAVSYADLESLTLQLGVRVVTTFNLNFTSKSLQR